MSKIPQIFTGSRICIICEGDEEYEYLEKLISLDVWKEMEIYQHDIRTNIRIVQVTWYWYSVIQIKNLMNNMLISSEKSTNFMELKMLQTRLLYMEIPVPCKSSLNIGMM